MTGQNSPIRKPAAEPYIVVRRGLTKWNVVKVEPENGLLIAQVKASFADRRSAWGCARASSKHYGIALLEGGHA